MPSKKPVIAIRTTEELINKFQVICDKENRSMSNMGEYLIMRYIEEYEAKQEKETRKQELGKSSISRTG